MLRRTTTGVHRNAVGVAARAAVLVTTLVAVVLLSAPAPATADWLVMNDGTRVETAGPWEQRGGLLVFDLPGGTLSSVRASEVDLEASRQATEIAARPPEPVAEPEPAPKPKAKYVYTEKELPPVSRLVVESSSPEAEGAATAGTGDTAAGGDARLQVTEWDVTTPDELDGSRVVGRIRNVGDELLTSVAMEVRAFSASGANVGRVLADITPGPVAPDRVIDFSADFPAIYGITAVKFDLRGSGFLEGGGEPPATDAAAAQGAADSAATPPGE